MLRSQLVAVLNKLPDVEVVVDGYEGGTQPVTEKSVGLGWVDKCDGMGDFFGEYGDFTVGQKPDVRSELDTELVQTILISRVSLS